MNLNKMKVEEYQERLTGAVVEIRKLSTRVPPQLHSKA